MLLRRNLRTWSERDVILPVKESGPILSSNSFVITACTSGNSSSFERAGFGSADSFYIQTAPL